MKTGFTLIEMLITVAIFSVVIAAGSGVFVSAIRGQQRILASQEVLAQTSYVLEYMSKVLRMAQKDLTGDCLTTVGAKYNYETNPEKNRIRFLNYKAQCQEFFLEGNQIKERKSPDSTAANFGSPLPLTSESLEVSAFKIGPDTSWDQNDTDQPRVTIFLKIKGKGLKAEQQPEIKIQTTISQRNLDIRR